MAPGKIPVGRTPICDLSYLRRIAPIWVHRRVPCRFWEDPAHRRDYLLWLGQKLHFRYMEDYYRLTPKDMRHNSGAGLAVCWWNSSVVEGVKECFPQYEWHEWLFGTAPMGFWKRKENRHRYMRWLGARLGYRRPEDWYAARGKDFRSNFGGYCLTFYHGSPALAAMDLFPKHRWQQWKFPKVPCGFWHQAENRRRYLEWLGRQLGFRRPEDWRRVRWADFTENYGAGLLWYFGSHLDVLRDRWPEIDWGTGRRKVAPDGVPRGPRPSRTIHLGRTP